MTFSVYAYIYLILFITTILSIPLSIYRKDGKLGAIVVCLFLFGLGLSNNFQLHAMVFELGWGQAGL